MIVNRSVPSATVIPELAYENVAQASDWHRAQLVLGDGAVIVTDRDSEGRGSVLVRVPDVDRHHERAEESGARILMPPTDYPYGERQYISEDLGGHRWTFSESIADVDPSSWGGTLR
jgi:uncharacterized glyoxalase superfamily protein PhnB